MEASAKRLPAAASGQNCCISSAAGVILLYCTLSPVLTWLNKYLLRASFCSQGLRNGPALVTFTQQLVTALIMYAYSRYHHHHPPSRHPPAKINKCIKLLLPVAVLFVLQLTLCNASLRSIPLSSYQAARSSSLIFSVLINIFLLHEPVSLPSLAAVVLVGVGFVLSVFDPSQTICVISVAFGVLASLAGVIYMAQCRRVLRHAGGGIVIISERDFVQYVSGLAAILLVPFVLYDLKSSLNNKVFPLWSLLSGRQGWAFLATLVLAPLMPLCTAYCLRYHMSPLGCTVCGFAKSCIQTALGNWFFGDALTSRSLFGVVLCLSGSLLYSQLATTSKQQHQQQVKTD